jgi:hypothetical protein
MARRGSPRAGQRLTPEKATSHLAAWKQSGATLSEYARSVGLSYQRLHWWRLRLGAPQVAEQPVFLPVRVLESPAMATDTRGAGLEIHASGGLQILVPADFDASALERLLLVVRRSSC